LPTQIQALRGRLTENRQILEDCIPIQQEIAVLTSIIGGSTVTLTEHTDNITRRNNELKVCRKLASALRNRRTETNRVGGARPGKLQDLTTAIEDILSSSDI
jgi:hypothetical protein